MPRPSAWIMQLVVVEQTFHDIDRCVSETTPILKAAGDQGVLKIDTIEGERRHRRGHVPGRHQPRSEVRQGRRPVVRAAQPE